MSEEGEGVMDMDEFKKKAEEMNQGAAEAGFESADSTPPPFPNDMDQAA
jgi:hypothetical protein